MPTRLATAAAAYYRIKTCGTPIGQPENRQDAVVERFARKERSVIWFYVSRLCRQHLFFAHHLQHRSHAADRCAMRVH